MSLGVRRRDLLAVLAAVTAGCTGSSDVDTQNDNPAVGEVTPMGDMQLESPAFDHGEPIPRKYGKEYENVNPALEVENVPPDAETLSLVMDDPDAPGGTFVHWLVWNVPPDVERIPEDWDPPADVAEGENGFGNVGYDGPKPPSEHTYRFKLFAVDSTLDLDSTASVEQLGDAMGTPVARTQLDGTYAP